MSGSRCAAPLVIAGAAAQAIAFRDSVYSDGVAYLDLSDAFLAGRWSDAVSGLWSPLYPALLAAARWIGGTGAEREVGIAHALNLVLFLAAFAAFRFFRARTMAAAPLTTLLFGWAALDLVRIAKVGPDLLVLAAVLLAAGLVLDPGRPRRWLALGAVLAAGYYAKAVMFPLALVFFGAGMPAARRAGQLRFWAAGVALFAALAAPLAVAVSRKTGTLSFSDAGRLNYLWHVNGLPDAHWRGGGAVHPTLQVLASPAVYAFAAPVGGTYPVWFDPSYWYAGARPRFSLRAQAAACARAVRRTARDLFTSRNAVVAVPLAFGLGLAISRARRAALTAALRRRGAALVPAAAGLAMFLCVHVETRYIAPFILILAVGALASAAETQRGSGRTAAWIFGTVTIVVGAWLAVTTVVTAAAALMPALVIGREDRLAPEAARGLLGLGARPGDAVFVAGDGWTAAAWARRARVRITGETPSGDVAGFWVAAAVRPEALWDAVAKTGAGWVVAETAPPSELERGWMPLGRTGLYGRRAP